MLLDASDVGARGRDVEKVQSQERGLLVCDRLLADARAAAAVRHHHGGGLRLIRALLLALLLLVGGSHSFPSFPSKGTAAACTDLEQQCAAWAASGECERNLGYMKLHACRASCKSCNMDTADLSPVAVRASPIEELELTQKREHGWCRQIPTALRWSVDEALASKIACFNRKGAEPSGSFVGSGLLEAAAASSGPITFYDSATRRPLFVAPRNRTMQAFLDESRRHGWPMRSRAGHKQVAG